MTRSCARAARARAREPHGDQRARHIPTLAPSLASHTSESSKSRGREGGGHAARREPGPGSDERSAKISSGDTVAAADAAAADAAAAAAALLSPAELQDVTN